MISKCTHCNKPIQLSGAQKVKIKGALSKLKPGTSLKFGCPHCKKTIELKPDTPPAKKRTKPAPAKSAPSPSAKPEKSKAPDVPLPVNTGIKPPDPPDISWLEAGEMKDKEVVKDVPTAMVLMHDGPDRPIVADVFKKSGYQLFYPESIGEAIRSMQFKDYAAVVFHTGFEENAFEDSVFHGHMMRLGMGKRRYIFYMLIGDEFNTLYDLEALAYSANLVVNNKEIKHMDVMVKKAQRDYDDLFGPYIEMLKAHGKR